MARVLLGGCSVRVAARMAVGSVVTQLPEYPRQGRQPKPTRRACDVKGDGAIYQARAIRVTLRS